MTADPPGTGPKAAAPGPLLMGATRRRPARRGSGGAQETDAGPGPAGWPPPPHAHAGVGLRPSPA